ncbi:bifunctional DNA primase/polymerase [Mycobacterium sp.]|uniref:bifunctional DNA primase/polymerase n=1 Tax=Mycobacterium sp. TaxID=1785 RepID=UPI0031DF67A5
MGTLTAMLSVPDIAADDDNLTAALAYAKAGWYILPVKSGTKDPGSIVGKGWPAKSSRDPKQLTAWFAGTNYGIALHCGRSGAIVLDVDDPEHVPDEVLLVMQSDAPYQSSRPDTPTRGHYLLLNDTGHRIGNSLGKLATAHKWGEIRGANGVIIAAPTVHPEGGHYRWIRTGAVPPIPDFLADMLPESTTPEDTATDAQVKAFLDAHNDGTMLEAITGLANALTAKLDRRASCHMSTLGVVTDAMAEASAGLYPARRALEALWPIYRKTATTGTSTGRVLTVRKARSDFAGITAWAIGQAPAKAERAAERVRERMSFLNPDVEEVESEEFRDDGAAGDDLRPRVWRACDLQAAEQPRWLAKGRLQSGAINLLVGDEGIGKSLLWVWLVAAVTTGKPLPEFGIPHRDPADVLLVLTEDSWSSTVLPRLDVAGADLSRVHVICIERDGSGAPVFPRDIDLIIGADPAPALVVVDAWLDTVPTRLRVRDPQDARVALHGWKEAAAATDAAVLLLIHTNRVGSASTRDKYGATYALRQKARTSLYAQNDDDGHLLVGPDKMNNGRAAPASMFGIESVQHFDPTDDDDGTVPLLAYVGDSDRTASEHVADRFEDAQGGDSDGRSTAENAAGWLTDYLQSEGPNADGGDAKRCAAKNGLSERTLKRAAAKLGVVYGRSGFGKDTKVTWSLPTQCGPTGPTDGKHDVTAGHTVRPHSGHNGNTGPSETRLADQQKQGENTQSGQSGQEKNTPQAPESAPDVTPNPSPAPGGLTDQTPGVTDRVQEALAKAKAAQSAANGHGNPTPQATPDYRRPGCVCIGQPRPCDWCQLAAGEQGGVA